MFLILVELMLRTRKCVLYISVKTVVELKWKGTKP